MENQTPATLTLKGIVEAILFNNPENGYIVFLLSIDDYFFDLIYSKESDSKEKLEILEKEDIGRTVRCVGHSFELEVSEEVEVKGNFGIHKKYGKQFEAESIEKTLPSDLENIEIYLASGIIPGVGKAKARKIVSKFGKESFEIIENNPARLAEISGISNAGAISIGVGFAMESESRNTMLYLQKL
ncbi:MAG: helix-hairpin-helix domain-containing protein, partial [Defluviitaleaceae bacterium]|nr:helix-hairpin-helix domain-containing protein [Defluviitaleaceae bacterium]